MKPETAFLLWIAVAMLAALATTILGFWVAVDNMRAKLAIVLAVLGIEL